jgi:hypothetical protein
MSGNVTLERDGHTVDSQYVVASSTTDLLEASGYFYVLEPGRYTVQVQVSTSGPYWSPSTNSALHTEPISADVLVATR